MLARTFSVSSALFFVACCGVAQTPGLAPKPGAYEVTLMTTTSSPVRGERQSSRVIQACLTQEMIDRYNAIVPDQLTRSCQLVNVLKKPAGMTADIACSSAINGSGTVAINWSDSEHAKGTIHFSGVVHPGDSDIKIEWSAQTTYLYKGPDCSDSAMPR